MFSTEDFESIQWHDNAIHAFRIIEGELCGDLVLDIDFIVEWLELVDGIFQFRVAPSDLRFHEISDLVISINYEAASAIVQPITIYEIRREDITYRDGSTSFSWEIELHWPPNSFISFRSAAFTQSQRMAPVTIDSQWLVPELRDA
ncbi:hypothetical protein ACTSKR_12875 [Chitinibacteraceae bacterium HSL-7]